MKTIEAVIPQQNVSHTLAQLRDLAVEDVVVETVKVYKKGEHQTMTYRGCRYERELTDESKIHVVVADQNATAAESILGHAAVGAA